MGRRPGRVEALSGQLTFQVDYDYDCPAREPGPSRREASDSPTLNAAGVYTPRRRLRL